MQHFAFYKLVISFILKKAVPLKLTYYLQVTCNLKRVLVVEIHVIYLNFNFSPRKCYILDRSLYNIRCNYVVNRFSVEISK